jgi:hypothetical protein
LVNYHRENKCDSEVRQATFNTDREYAGVIGDQVWAVVEASSKLIVEETAARLGFGDSGRIPSLSIKSRERSGRTSAVQEADRSSRTNRTIIMSFLSFELRLRQE